MKPRYCSPCVRGRLRSWGWAGPLGPWSCQHGVTMASHLHPGLLRQYSLWLNDTGLVEADPGTICKASQFKTALW